jgi:hypothetical protein
MTTTVTFAADQRRAVGQQYVYLKQKWQDSWVLYYDTHCLDATWCLSPSMPTATLTRDYGAVKGFGTTSYTNTSRLDVLGWYVKVVMETDTVAGTTATWYGVISHDEDEHKGFVKVGETTLATGTQTLHCYGLEKLLDTEYLSESWVDTGAEAPIVVQLPITFNRNGRPNKNDRLIAPAIAPVFEGQAIDPAGTLRPEARWWSSYDIVAYLLAWATPKDSFRTRNARVPFEMVELWALSFTDKPELDQEGHTVLSLLNRLIDRRRLRSFYLGVDTTRTPNVVQLHLVPWNNATVDTGIPDADVLLPNTNTLNVVYDYSQNTASSIRTTRVQRYDRIVVRGARRTSTATWVVDTGYLTPEWSTAEETAYEAAASGVTGYAGWDSLKKMQCNAEVRAAEELSAVYSWFKLPDTWAGQNLEVASTSTHIVFPADADATHIEKQCIHEVVWEPYIPLYEHVDYSGTKIADEATAPPRVRSYRQPKAFFKIPTDARWVAGDKIATLAEASGSPVVDGRNFRWSAAVYVQPDTRTLEVRVSGEPQHVIAATDFTKLTADRDVGDWDYRSKKMAITATLRDNRYAEGKYPTDGFGDTSFTDTQYGYVVYAGDGYRLDYVVPTTVIDVETDGTLITSTGGYVRDDTDLLNALARVAYEWWNQERVILTLSTTQLTSSVQPGYFIETVGTAGTAHRQTVNTVVSEVRITWPLLDVGQVDVPVMQIVTGAGELDPMTLAPRQVDIMSRTKARARR